MEKTCEIIVCVLQTLPDLHCSCRQGNGKTRFPTRAITCSPLPGESSIVKTERAAAQPCRTLMVGRSIISMTSIRIRTG